MRWPSESPAAMATALLAGAFLGGCATLPVPGSSTPLFGSESSAHVLDFEGLDLGGTVPPLERRSGRWSVADHPGATSGQQVLIQRSEEAAALEVADSGGGEVLRGEVALRPLLGNRGAGIGCRRADGVSYAALLEAGKGRIVLRELGQDGEKTLATKPLPPEAMTDKGRWTRIGIRCSSTGIHAYLGDRKLLSTNLTAGDARLALFADPGMTVQFDDLRYR